MYIFIYLFIYLFLKQGLRDYLESQRLIIKGYFQWGREYLVTTLRTVFLSLIFRAGHCRTDLGASNVVVFFVFVTVFWLGYVQVGFTRIIWEFPTLKGPFLGMPGILGS